jgi:tetratricopeptide (TPR) repeat protein
MKKFRMVFILLLAFTGNLLANHDRNFTYEGEKIYEGQPANIFKKYKYRTDEVCKTCFKNAYSDFDDSNRLELLSLIPEFHGDEHVCIGCRLPSFYSGYVIFCYRKEYPFLSRQLEFIKKYPDRTEFWPETSFKASKIKSEAILLFFNLFEKTSLNELAKYSNYRDKFILDTPYLKKIDREIFIKSLIANCFWFSDYYQVLEDLRIFAKKNMKIFSRIVGEIDIVLEELYKLYRPWYEEIVCETKLPEVVQEIIFIDYVFGNWASEDDNLNTYFEHEESCDQPNWFRALCCLAKGQAYSEALEYERAIEQFCRAIEYNPKMVDAYIERAIAYFEFGEFDLAVEDYKKATFLKFDNQSFPKNGVLPFESNIKAWNFWDQGEYYVGTSGYYQISVQFISGVIEGANYSAGEFVPNTLGTLSGLSNGLWALVCDPNKVSKDFLDGLYDLVDYIRSNSNQEILEQVIPELRELFEQWDSLSNEEISNKIGFIVGKYGFDVFAPCACLKVLKRYQQLKQANALLTLGECAYNPKKAVIFEEVAKRQALRKNLFEDGKIKIHWGMQDKHIPGSHNFDPKRSQITITKETLDRLVSQNAGTGQKIQGALPYNPGYRERVNFGEIIGDYVKLDKNGNIVSSTPTKNGIIHYSNKGMHVVPSDPKAIIQ